jgi:hypothetical protein
MGWDGMGSVGHLAEFPGPTAYLLGSYLTISFPNFEPRWHLEYLTDKSDR